MDVMKLSLSIKVVVGIAVILLCVGVAVYSFMRLNSVEQRQEFDLYTLVPEDVVAVFETDRMMETLEAIDEIKCSTNGPSLHLSEYSGCLRDFFDAWIEASPHALSRQMNKVLLSFHQSDTALDEVLYCALGTRDYEQVETFVKHYCASSFSVKSSKYKGKVIHIYPIGEGRFLAVYLTKQFMVLSFQKRLLEQVIDAQNGKSLAQDNSFKKICANKQRNVEAMLYLRMKSVPMGSGVDSLQWKLAMSEWMEFDLKLTDNAIYCPGISYGANETGSLVNTLHQQKNISMNVGEDLPASTVLYQCWSASDKEALFSFTAGQKFFPSVFSDYMAARDKEWLSFMKEYAGEYVLSCFFTSEDESNVQDTCAVVVIPLADEIQAQHYFYSWLQRMPREENAPMPPRFRPDYERFPHSRAFRKYLLPRSSFFVQLTGVVDTSFYTYACFYRGKLLLAADAFSLSAYIDALERGRVLQNTSSFRHITHTLASSCNFLMVADLERLSDWPSTYKQFIPTFFWDQIDFFLPFSMALQFTNVEDGVYPNVTLLHENILNDYSINDYLPMSQKSPL